MPIAGGDARLLVSHAATESHPAYSPDGRTLALVSDRTGGGDVYLLTIATGDLRRLTFDDGNEVLDGWSADGQWIYYSSGTRDIAGNDIYRVRAAGGTPMLVSADRFTNEFFAAPSPDGQSIWPSARVATPPRSGGAKATRTSTSPRSGSCAGSSTTAYEQVVERGAKSVWPMWSADGRSLYYVSDRSGAENLWVKPLGGQARALTQFRAGRVLWPNISYDGRTIVFERKLRDLEARHARRAAHGGALSRAAALQSVR